ncbi:MAG: T9SS type A sorting domain-containing protein [Flavobacteriaceae bacterium]
MKQNVLFYVVFFSTFQFALLCQEWLPLGSPILGDTESRLGFSTSISADSNRIAVGAPTDNSTGDVLGKVLTFSWNGSDWQPMGDPFLGHENNGRFGIHVALSGNGSMLVVSEHLHSGGGVSQGAVFIYRWTGVAWEEDGVLYGSNFQDFFGSGDVSISLDGNTVAIGSQNVDVNGIVNAGQIAIFERLGPQQWVPKGTPISGGSENLGLGRVALNGDGSRFALGAFGHDENRGLAQVYLFENGDWSKVAQFPGDIPGRRLGFSVSMNEEGTVIAASSAQHSSGIFGGQGYIYKEDTIGDWSQYGSTIVDAPEEYFGADLVLNGVGDLLAIGAPDFVNGGGGKVFTFKDDGTSFQPYNTILIGEVGDSFGTGLSFNTSGSRLSVGATDANNNSGKVQTYIDNILATPESSLLQEIVVFPNPVGEYIQFQLPSEIPQVNATLFDTKGSVLMEKHAVFQNQKLTIPYPQGIYLLEMEYNGNTLTKKIIKQ